MSQREDLTRRIVLWLQERQQTFSAPYGVLDSLKPVDGRSGYFRQITFGIARIMDATIDVWSPTNLVVRTTLDQNLDGMRLNSETALYAYLDERFPKVTYK